jgi:membrane-associated phospholipid phosphatase
MQKRTERIPLYVFTMICHLGGIWLAHELGKTELVKVLLVFYVVAIIFVVVTTKWKISLHAGVNAGLITIINIFYGWQYSWLYILLCLVCWARVYQKHHTWAQVIAGSVVGAGIVGVGLGII